MENNTETPILLLPPGRSGGGVEETQAVKISKPLIALNFALILSIVAMSFVVASVIRQAQIAKLAEKETTGTIFSNIPIEGRAAVVYDVANGKIIFQKNANARMPLASLTKLMTALTATDLVPLNSGITIRKEFLVGEGDTGLLPGETWKLKDLLDFSLMVSSNDGARSVASVVGAVNLKSTDYDLGRKDFILQMNAEAQKLALKQMYFINESGLDEGNTAGGYGSATDVAKLLEYMLGHNPEILETTKYETLTIDSGSRAHVAKNTNLDIQKIPGLLASKTGYTDLAGGNLAVAFDASIGRPIIVVVLGSSEKGRFSDVQNLVNASLLYTKE